MINERPVESQKPLLSWDRRDELGMLWGLLGTIRELYWRRPGSRFRGGNDEDGTAGAVLYALIVGTFSLFALHVGSAAMHSPTVFVQTGRDTLIDWIITRLLTYRVFFYPLIVAALAGLSAAMAHRIVYSSESPAAIRVSLRPIAYVAANTILILAIPSLLSVPRCVVFVSACMRNLNQAPDRLFLTYTVPFTDGLYYLASIASAFAAVIYFTLVSASAIGHAHANYRQKWSELRALLVFIALGIIATVLVRVLLGLTRT